jgi:AcrR family transcriptional regulator
MLEAAMGFFAENGFEASTRDLGRHLGVTQALLYKHFGSKEAFIAELMDLAFGDSRPSDPAILEDPSRSLIDRLCDFYRADTRSDGTRMRLFVRAGLAGWPLPARRGAQLTRSVFLPVIRALRKEAGLPDVDQKPMMRGERELAMMLHASIVFLGIREHVYRMPMPADRARIVHLYAETFVPGALSALARLHGQDGVDGLVVRQLAPARPPG